MRIRCISPFGHHVPGDETEVPDGAAVDPRHYEPVTAAAPPLPPSPPRPPVPAPAVPAAAPKEM